MASHLRLQPVVTGTWRMLAAVFEHPVATASFAVTAPVGNSITTSASGKRRTDAWKQAVAAHAREVRGGADWRPGLVYAITIGFSFSPSLHGYQPLDVENFLKPTLDGLAAGLFCAADQDMSAIGRYDYDDSGFRFLFVQRLADAVSPGEEGAAFHVSAAPE